MTVLGAAGYNVRELYSDGEGYTGSELKAAGFGAKDCRRAGLNVKMLVEVGYGAEELTNAGIHVKDLMNLYGVKDIHALGFALKDLRAGGFEVRELK